MYWYFKYPLFIIIILLMIGICVLIWRSGISPYVGKDTPVVEEQVAPSGVIPEEYVPQDAAPANVDAIPAANTPVSKPDTVKQNPVTEFKQLPQDIKTALAQAEDALNNDNPKLARDIAHSFLKAEYCTEYDTTWYALAAVINSANKIFMNSKAPCDEKKSYVIAPGDSLVRIAYRNNTTVEALQRLNGLKSTSAVIHPGNSLQYISGTWAIKVSKSQFLLSLYLDDVLYRIYKISTGRQDRTPVGIFTVNSKLMNPAWTPPGQNIPFGDPRNILGTRWIGLKPTAGTDVNLLGYGIHGTTEPETIGSAASLGCVRMLNEEVEELYDFIPSSFQKLHIHVFITE